MCTKSCISFGLKYLREEDLAGKDILEVGAADHNGSLRAHAEALGPRKYWAVDILDVPGVDEVCTAEELVERFGEESYDAVICTEVLEHIRDWRAAVSNMKRVLRPGGKLLITTRSRGFAYHSDPYDFWRYEVKDFERIFADMNIAALERDPLHAGVFIMAEKPAAFREAELSELKLYSILKRRRLRDIRMDEVTPRLVRLNNFDTKCRIWLASRLPPGIKEFLKKKIFRITA